MSPFACWQRVDAGQISWGGETAMRTTSKFHSPKDSRANLFIILAVFFCSIFWINAQLTGQLFLVLCRFHFSSCPHLFPVRLWAWPVCQGYTKHGRVTNERLREVPLSKERRSRREKNTINAFHLFFRELVSIVWLELLTPKSATPFFSSCSSLSSVQIFERYSCWSVLWRCRPFLFRANTFPCSKLPVLLHFLASGGANEPGVSNELSERLLIVSDKCSLLNAWLDPPPIPVSSSEGSMESCLLELRLGLSSQLLWLLWRPLVTLRVKLVWTECNLWLGSEEGRVSSGTGQSRGWGKDRSLLGVTLKLMPPSSVVCRLTSQFPVANDDSLWDGGWNTKCIK